jgi:hypothetical protein
MVDLYLHSPYVFMEWGFINYAQEQLYLYLHQLLVPRISKIAWDCFKSLLNEILNYLRKQIVSELAKRRTVFE